MSMSISMSSEAMKYDYGLISNLVTDLKASSGSLTNAHNDSNNAEKALLAAWQGAQGADAFAAAHQKLDDSLKVLLGNLGNITKAVEAAVDATQSTDSSVAKRFD